MEKTERWKAEIQLIQKALTDPNFSEQLKKSARETISRELSLSLPEGLKVQVLEEGKEEMIFVLPSAEASHWDLNQEATHQKTRHGFVRKAIEADVARQFEETPVDPAKIAAGIQAKVFSLMKLAEKPGLKLPQLILREEAKDEWILVLPWWGRNAYYDYGKTPAQHGS